MGNIFCDETGEQQQETIRVFEGGLTQRGGGPGLTKDRQAICRGGKGKTTLPWVPTQGIARR